MKSDSERAFSAGPHIVVVAAQIAAIIFPFASATLRADDKAAPRAVAPFDATRAREFQDACAKEHNAKIEITNSIGTKLRLIPNGEFQMGSPESEQDRDAGEAQHSVRITKPFYLGRHEVTQREWKLLMGVPGANWKPSKEGDDYPASLVGWYDAVEFCNRLSVREKRRPFYRLANVEHADGGIFKADVTVLGGPGYRLPTEAEWGFACRAGTATRYYFGDDSRKLGEYAWFQETTEKRDEKYPHRVGLKAANPFGLHDMLGNVWELCQDRHDANYYSNAVKVDPQGPTAGSQWVKRGGDWTLPASYCRAAKRGICDPEDSGISTGFRVVLGTNTENEK